MASSKNISQNKDTVSIPRHFLVDLAEVPIFTAQVYKVLLFLLCRLDCNRYTMVDVRQVAETLCLNEDVVWGAIYELEDQGVIVRGCDIHTSDGYRFCLGDRYLR